jgi:hypothetical protein
VTAASAKLMKEYYDGRNGHASQVFMEHPMFHSIIFSAKAAKELQNTEIK